MAHRKLPVNLRDKITKYYEHRFQGKLFEEEKLLAEVSRPLRKVGMKPKEREIHVLTTSFPGSLPPGNEVDVHTIKFE